MKTLPLDAIDASTRVCAPFSVERIRIVDTLAVPAHSHTGRHLMIVTEGVVADGGDGAFRVAGPGTARFSPHEQRHAVRVLEAPFSCVLITLRDDTRAQFPTAGAYVTHAGISADARAIADQIDVRGAAAAVAVTGLVWHLVAKSNLLVQHQEAPQTPQWLTDLCVTVQSRCTAPLDPRALARDAGVHPAHLSRAFRRHFGRTLREYVRECRLQRAVRELERSDATISSIAADTGFADHAHLSRDLRWQTGQTPSEVRRAARCKCHSSVGDDADAMLSE